MYEVIAYRDTVICNVTTKVPHKPTDVAARVPTDAHGIDYNAYVTAMSSDDCQLISQLINSCSPALPVQ